MYQFLRELSNRKKDLFNVMEIVTFQAGDQEAPIRNWVHPIDELVHIHISLLHYCHSYRHRDQLVLLVKLAHKKL